MPAWVGAVCLLLWAGLASAQQSVVLLSLVSEDGDDGLAVDLSDAVYVEAGEVQEWDLSSNRPSLMQMTMANDCEISDHSCRAAIGKGLGAQQVIYGTLRRTDGDAVAVELLMFDSSGGDVVASANAKMSATDRRALPSVAAGLLRELRGLASGEQGAAPAMAQSGDNTVMPDVSPLAAKTIDDELPRDDGYSSGSNDWIGYTLLGVAAVSLGGTVFSWVQIDAASSDSTFADYRREVGVNMPGASDVCAVAKDGEHFDFTPAELADVVDSCDRGSTFETLQYVFLGAFAVSGGLGIYFLLDGDDEGVAAASGPQLAIEPRFGPNAGGVSASLRF